MRVLENPNFNFIKWRWHALVLSIVVIAAGVATIVARGGLPLGVDFSGGTVMVLKFAAPTAEDAVRAALGPLGSDAIVQRYGQEQEHQILIRLPQSGEEAESLSQAAARVQEMLRAANMGDFTPINSEIVGPTVGRDLQRKGVLATLSALAGILLYIGIRFRFSFAAGAIVATFHDILIVIAFLTWFGYDLTLNIVAAILTIAGYSVNDTIVIFDRVRENQRMVRREPLDQLVNKSVNQTLARTIVTAGTTFLAVFALYLFGGEVLEGFAFAMLVGIVAGTYSTVFIASAIAILLTRASNVGVRPAGASTSDARRKARA